MATRSARTADKSTNDRHARILKALLQKPTNKYCVDCRKKDPRWASFNLGCFMCIRCSGIHRSMGTHISKVKSVDLDNWTPEQVENMIKWGNEKANKFWEARLPEVSVPNEHTSGIDPWIRSKYEWKQFAKPGAMPDPLELGPIDEALLQELHGGSHARARAERSSETVPGSFGIIAPPPSNIRSSGTKRPTSVSSAIQGAELFSIDQPKSSPTMSRPPQQDLFALDDPAPQSPVTTQAQIKRNSSTPQRPPSSQFSSATQDLFSLVSNPNTSSGQPAQANSVPSAVQQQQQQQPQQTQGKTSNTDWKNSIMSLYGNQSTGSNAGRPSQHPYNQQQQQQQQFGQLHGMNSFGFGQQPQQPQQQSIWGDNDGFGSMQTAPVSTVSGSSGFGGFHTASPAFGTQTSNNRPGSMGTQDGDLFNVIANTSQSATSKSVAQSKNSNSAFGDLTW